MNTSDFLKPDALASLPRDDLAAAATLEGSLKRLDSALKGEPSKYQQYLAAHGLVLAFLESRALPLPTEPLSGLAKTDIEIIRSSFNGLVRSIRKLVRQNQVQESKQRYLQYAPRMRSHPKHCLVIMPMRVGHEAFVHDQRYKLLIEPAVVELGYSCSRLDRDPGVSVIHSRMYDVLFNADLVVADLTNSNSNVLYELGMRHAVGLPVVQLAPMGEALPFDIAGLRTVMYQEDVASWVTARSEIQEAVMHGASPITSMAVASEEAVLEKIESHIVSGNLAAAKSVAECVRLMRLTGAGRQRFRFIGAVASRMEGTIRAPRTSQGESDLDVVSKFADAKSDLSAYALLELSLNAFSFNDIENAMALATSIGRLPQCSARAPASVLLAIYHIARGDRGAAQRELGGSSELDKPQEVYVGLHKAVVHLSLRQQKAAAASLNLVRRWIRPTSILRTYPYCELVQEFDRELLRVITEDPKPKSAEGNEAASSSKPLLDEFLTGKERVALRGVGRVTARIAQVLRCDNEALQCLSEVSKEEGWFRDVDLLRRSIQSFETRMFAWAG